MDLLSLTLATYLVAQTDNCSKTYIDGNPFTFCVKAEPECKSILEMPDPRLYAAQKGLELVYQDRVMFEDTNRFGVLNVFYNGSEVEYWVFFPDTQEVCLMADGYKQV
jgi:hypothetical protein